MNKYLLTLLCSGSLMTLAGCGKPEETKVVETEVAVAEAKSEAVEIDVNAAEVVEKTVAVVEEKQATTVEVAEKQQDDKF